VPAPERSIEGAAFTETPPTPYLPYVIPNAVREPFNQKGAQELDGELDKEVVDHFA
jgi:hypothetical protein